MKDLRFLITITKRGLGEKFIELYNENGLPIVLNCMGNGTASSDILDYFGIEDTEKDVIFTITNKTTAKAVMRELTLKMGIYLPGMGIAFTVPLASIAGKELFKYLSGEEAADQNKKGDEKEMSQEIKYELIIAISERGYTDDIMEAARSVGARGGTVLHAKGTGSEHARKFLGISIAEEKEMTLIVAATEEKSKIMKAILAGAGPATDAKAILFSLPVTGIAGLRLLEEEDIDT